MTPYLAGERMNIKQRIARLERQADKKISGFNPCLCDQRYRPRLIQRPNAYFVICPNCGLRTPEVERPPYASHVLAQRQAMDDWNQGRFV